jgi:hypothetical protein
VVNNHRVCIHKIKNRTKRKNQEITELTLFTFRCKCLSLSVDLQTVLVIDTQLAEGETVSGKFTHVLGTNMNALLLLLLLFLLLLLLLLLLQLKT